MSEHIELLYIHSDAALALLQRHLIYTGITRGKKLVVLIRRRRWASLSIMTARNGSIRGCWRV